MAKNKKNISVTNLILGIIAIISGILISIFQESYIIFILIAIGLFFVGLGSYNLAKKEYAQEIIEIIAGILLVFLAVYKLNLALILLGIAVALICTIMLVTSIQKKEKGLKASITYAIIILGLLAGAIIISLAFVAESWLYIFFGVTFSVLGFLIVLRSI